MVAVRTLYAIKHAPTKKYFGDSETIPVEDFYGLYCLEMAERRIQNMRHPEEWEAVVSPRQSNWPRSTWRNS